MNLNTSDFVVAVDFDGPIHDQKGGYRRELDGEVTEGAKAALEKFRDDGAVIIIHTVRACDRTINGKFEEAENIAVRAWLDEHHIPFDDIWCGRGKPFAHVYIDDRAVVFKGDWGLSACEAILMRAKETLNV